MSQPRHPTLRDGNQNDMPCSFFGFSGIYPTSEGNIEIVANHNKIAVIEDNSLGLFRPLRLEGINEDETEIFGNSGLLYKKNDSDDLFWAVGGRVINLCGGTKAIDSVSIIDSLNADSIESIESVESCDEPKNDETSLMRDEIDSIKSECEYLKAGLRNLNNIVTLINKNWMINANDSILKIEALERIVQNRGTVSKIAIDNARVIYSGGHITNDFLVVNDRNNANKEEIADIKVIADDKKIMDNNVNCRCEMLDMYVEAQNNNGVDYLFYYKDGNQFITKLHDDTADEILALLYYLPSNSLLSLVAAAGLIELRAVKIQNILSKSPFGITISSAVLENIVHDGRKIDMRFFRDWLFVQFSNTLLYIKIGTDNQINVNLVCRHLTNFYLENSNNKELCAIDDHGKLFIVNLCPSVLVWSSVCDISDECKVAQNLLRFVGAAFEKGRRYYIAGANPRVGAITKKKFGNVLFGRALSTEEILLHST